jgi:hypothetical protein
MRRDMLTTTTASLATALAVWVIWGNPREDIHFTRHLQTAQWVQADPDLKRLSEQSPYMRNER